MTTSDSNFQPVGTSESQWELETATGLAASGSPRASDHSQISSSVLGPFSSNIYQQSQVPGQSGSQCTVPSTPDVTFYKATKTKYLIWQIFLWPEDTKRPGQPTESAGNLSPAQNISSSKHFQRFGSTAKLDI